MTTNTDIANRALAAVAAKSLITNLVSDQSTEARQVKLVYDSTRDALLRSAPWGFAYRTDYLSLLKSAPGTPENLNASGPWDPLTMPAIPWLYEYAYPSNCVFMQQVLPKPIDFNDVSPPIFSASTGYGGPVFTVAGVQFKIGNSPNSLGQPTRVINTNARSAIGRYMMRITVEDLWDESFQQAMVMALAVRIALPLTGSRDVIEICMRQAMQEITTARVRDGNENPTKIDHVPDWIATRTSYMSADIVGYKVEWEQPTFLVV